MQKYAAVYNGKLYPPKYVISIANKKLTGEEGDLKGGEGCNRANTILTDLKFPVIDKSKFNSAVIELKRIKNLKSEYADLAEIIDSKTDVFAHYQSIFKPDNIPNFKIDEFLGFLDFKNNHHWSTYNGKRIGLLEISVD